VAWGCRRQSDPKPRKTPPLSGVTRIGRGFPHVPEHIEDTASEAYACHIIRAYRAAVSLAHSRRRDSERQRARRP